MELNKILSLQVSELPESDQIIINQITGLTKTLNIKLDKLNKSLESLEPKEKENENENKK
tara:strand:- start:3017 stop:3196 length:180 start_codon:yes stop_codon:yes gene_type:complete